jgi:hypothetical protein
MASKCQVAVRQVPGGTNQFFEAVKARQAAAICEDGLDHQRDLELLDAGIEAVNNLVASQCSS